MAFRLLGKHHYDPDHPGVSGPRVLEALQRTVRELAARGPKALLRSIPANELVALLQPCWRGNACARNLRDGDFDVSLPVFPNYNTRKVKVQLSHWSQLLALPLATQVALTSADDNRKVPF